MVQWTKLTSKRFGAMFAGGFCFDSAAASASTSSVTYPKGTQHNQSVDISKPQQENVGQRIAPNRVTVQPYVCDRRVWGGWGEGEEGGRGGGADGNSGGGYVVPGTGVTSFFLLFNSARSAGVVP